MKILGTLVVVLFLAGFAQGQAVESKLSFTLLEAEPVVKELSAPSKDGVLRFCGFVNFGNKEGDEFILGARGHFTRLNGEDGYSITPDLIVMIWRRGSETTELRLRADKSGKLTFEHGKELQHSMLEAVSLTTSQFLLDKWKYPHRPSDTALLQNVAKFFLEEWPMKVLKVKKRKK